MLRLQTREMVSYKVAMRNRRTGEDLYNRGGEAGERRPRVVRRPEALSKALIVEH